MKNFNIIYFGSPYYSWNVLQSILDSKFNVTSVVSQKTTYRRRNKKKDTAITLFANDNKSNDIIPNNETRKTKITLQKNQTTDKINNSNYGNKRFKIRIEKTKLILYALNFAKDYDNIVLN